MTGEPESDPAVWMVNPLVKRPVYLLEADRAPGGECPVPEGIEHCHGAEIRHADGWAECVNWEGECEAPGALHLHVHDCYPGGEFSLVCSRCK